jgi:hypothetical protein
MLCAGALESFAGVPHLRDRRVYVLVVASGVSRITSFLARFFRRAPRNKFDPPYVGCYWISGVAY